MVRIRNNKRRGASLIDVLFGTSLLAVTVSAAAIGLEMANTRVNRTQERTTLVNALSREIEVRKALAQRGQLVAGTSTITETINRKPYTITTTVTNTATASNPNILEIAANGSSTRPQSETVRLNTRVFNKQIGKVVSVNYSPSVTAYMTSFALNSYSGYGVGFYQQRIWNSLRTALGSEPLVDSESLSVPMRVSVSPATVTLNSDYTSVLTSGPVWAIGEGCIVDSGSTGLIQINVTGIPYSRYNIVMYFGYTTTDPIEQAWLEIDGKSRIPIEISDYSLPSYQPWMNQHFRNHKNCVVLGPLSGGNHTFKFISPTKAPRFHGLQVAER